MELGRQTRERMTVEGVWECFSLAVFFGGYLPPLPSPPLPSERYFRGVVYMVLRR